MFLCYYKYIRKCASTAVPPDLWETPGPGECKWSENSLLERTSFFRAKSSAPRSECSCSNTLAARKEAFTQALSWTNFSTTVSICLGANNLPDSSLDLLFAERSLCSVFHQPNAAGDVYPGPKSCTLWPYRERVERLFVLLCLAVFLNIRFTEIHNGGKILPQT